MPYYINDILNHLRSLQTWAAGKDMTLNLDMKTLLLEAKYRGRYFTMYPMFQGGESGKLDRLFHTDILTRETIGFGGWRPYRTIRHPLSTDKLLFKNFLLNEAIPTPESRVHDMGQPPVFDYVIKGARGSFGREIAGPYRANTLPAKDTWTQWSADNQTFIEQFIDGTTAKIWFWGKRPIFALSHTFPMVRGDGASSLDALVRRRLGPQRNWDTHSDRDLIIACLNFQGVDLSTIAPEGQEIWIDYRYARLYAAPPGNGIDSDSTLPQLMERSGAQIQQMGDALADLLRKAIPAPVLITVDCMIDHQGKIWWLEMNTNSLMPPEGYAAMFEDMFQ